MKGDTMFVNLHCRMCEKSRDVEILVPYGRIIPESPDWFKCPVCKGWTEHDVTRKEQA